MYWLESPIEAGGALQCAGRPLCTSTPRHEGVRSDRDVYLRRAGKTGAGTVSLACPILNYRTHRNMDEAVRNTWRPAERL